MRPREIRVLVVEDSLVVRTYVARLLAAEADFRVLPPAEDGQDAVDKARQLRPDVILMDLHLPVMDGVEAIRLIMSTQASPIVVLSGQLNRCDVDYTFEALQAGAVDVMAKPEGLGAIERAEFARELTRTLRLMSEVKVVTRHVGATAAVGESPRPHVVETGAMGPKDVVALGASTGGPPVVYELLAALPRPYPLPILISQHIADGFEQGLCLWLQGTGHPVQVPLTGTFLAAGGVYLSPAHASMIVDRDRRVRIIPAVDGEITPNIDRLFASVAEVFGAGAVGVLLTGMGADGAAGLATLRAAGAWTIAQDRDSAVVWGMPGAAVASGGACEVLAPERIGRRLLRVAG